MGSIYPTLDLLERHGLRAAFFILMLGVRDWGHFQYLHETAVPEECRLPRDLLMALADDFRLLMSSATRRDEGVEDRDLLDEFNRARKWHPTTGSLREFYGSMLFDKASSSRVLLDWSVGRTAMGIIHHRDAIEEEARTFRGTWEGFPDVDAVAKIINVNPLNDGQVQPRLLVDVRIREKLTEAVVNRLLAIETWRRTDHNAYPGALTLSFLIDDTVSARTIRSHKNVWRMVLTEDGRRLLAKAFASIGLSIDQH